MAIPPFKGNLIFLSCYAMAGELSGKADATSVGIAPKTKALNDINKDGYFGLSQWLSLLPWNRAL
jgi:hypothetical protein